MPPSILNCNPRVADVRTMRAAAFAPYILALTLLVVGVPLSYATQAKTQVARFLAASLALFVVTSFIKRGSFITAALLAACLMPLVVSVLFRAVAARSATDML